jgi:hypothetical protein
MSYVLRTSDFGYGPPVQSNTLRRAQEALLPREPFLAIIFVGLLPKQTCSGSDSYSLPLRVKELLGIAEVAEVAALIIHHWLIQPRVLGSLRYSQAKKMNLYIANSAFTTLWYHLITHCHTLGAMRVERY